MYNQSSGASKTCAVGLCTGLLAAAAVASSPALPALVPLAVEVVLIAFRTGLYAGVTAKSLEVSQGHASSWSSAVTGTNDKDAQAAISDFHHQKVCNTGLVRMLKTHFCHRKYQSRSVPTLARWANRQSPSVDPLPRFESCSTPPPLEPVVDHCQSPRPTMHHIYTRGSTSSGFLVAEILAPRRSLTDTRQVYPSCPQAQAHGSARR